MTDDAVGKVVRVWRYPVKSLAGESLEDVEVNARGLVGDRAYAVVTAGGKLGSGKTSKRMERVDGLLDLATSLSGDGVPLITLGGARMRADDEGIHKALSDALGRPVTLAAEAETSHFDAGPVHLLSTASLDWLRGKTPDAPTDERRLRPNIVVDLDGAAFSEDAWVGKEIIVGTARLRINKRTERCVMVTQAQRDLRYAPTALKAIAEANESCLGVYAEVVEPGSVSVGASVAVAD